MINLSNNACLNQINAVFRGHISPYFLIKYSDLPLSSDIIFFALVLVVFFLCELQLETLDFLLN